MSSQPFAPGRSHEPHAPRGELRAEDRPMRPVSLRRVARLFAPYRARLGGLLALICLGAELSARLVRLVASHRREGLVAQEESSSRAVVLVTGWILPSPPARPGRRARFGTSSARVTIAPSAPPAEEEKSAPGALPSLLPPAERS